MHADTIPAGVAKAVQCLSTGWTTGRSGFDPRQGERIFPLSSVSRPALGPTQPPVQWVPGVLCPGVKCGRGVTLTTHPHVVPRSRMSRSYTSSPPQAPPWRVARLLYFTFLQCYFNVSQDRCAPTTNCNLQNIEIINMKQIILIDISQWFTSVPPGYLELDHDCFLHWPFQYIWTTYTLMYCKGR
jgi:hypothetical protein